MLKFTDEKGQEHAWMSEEDKVLTLQVDGQEQGQVASCTSKYCSKVPYQGFRILC